MEAFDGSQRLVRGMEEDGCSDRGEAGILRRDTRDHPIIWRERRRRACVPAALALLAALTLALLLVVALGGRARQTPDSQPQIDHSSGAYAGQQRLEGYKNPSAMLTVPSGNVADQGYLLWEHDQGYAFCHGGFNYSNGELVVPRKGTYRVFLQITYNGNQMNSCDHDVLKLCNVIYLYRESYPEYRALLSSCDTVSCNLTQWSKSLYTAGLFSLEANSKLRVKSSHPDLIDKNEYLVFFGAERLA